MKTASISAKTSYPPWVFVLIYLTGLAGHALYTRMNLSDFAGGQLHEFGYWEVVLEIAASGYAFSYWILPCALWCMLRDLRGHARYDVLIRFGARTDWALARVRAAGPWIAVLVGGLMVVALVGGMGQSFSWQWQAASMDPVVLSHFSGLTRTFPVPVLSALVQGVALAVTLAVLTLCVAASGAFLALPWIPPVTAVLLLIWTWFSFRSEGVLTALLGPTTYVLPWRADSVLGLGPGGGVMVAVVASILAMSIARRLEINRAFVAGVPVRGVVVGAGILIVAALCFGTVDPKLPLESQAIFLLQGVGFEATSLIHFLANGLLVALPSLVVYREIVAALDGRGYAEMIRLGSPTRWYRRRLIQAAQWAIVYAGFVGLAAGALIALRTGSLPDLRAWRDIGAWGVALALQVMVMLLLLVLAGIVTRRIDSAAYATGAALVLAWPVGAPSRWSPSGQASLARFVDDSAPLATTLNVQPLFILLIWLAVLTTIALALANRSRGELN